MEQKLKRMFDYQKFQKNSRLDAMLSDAEGRYEDSLSDEDLELVSAAVNPPSHTIHMVFLPSEET